MNGVEFSQQERDALFEHVTPEVLLQTVADLTLDESSAELLSAVAKLKAGASANGLGLKPSGDLSRPGQARRRRASGNDKPAGTRVGKRVKPEEVERLCHELRAHFGQNEGDTFTGPQLARIVDVHDHHSGLFMAAIELLITGKHVSIVGKWRNGPVYGAYVEYPHADEVTRPTGGVQASLEPENGARTSVLAQDPEPEIPPPDLDIGDGDGDEEELEGVEEALADLDEDMPLVERIVLLVESRGPIRCSAIAEALGKSPSTIDMLLRGDLTERLQNGPSGWELRA